MALRLYRTKLQSFRDWDLSLKKTKPNIEIWLESLESELFFFHFFPLTYTLSHRFCFPFVPPPSVWSDNNLRTTTHSFLFLIIYVWKVWLSWAYGQFSARGGGRPFAQKILWVGVVIATKWRHYLLYSQHYFSLWRSMKSFSGASSNSRLHVCEVKTESVRALSGYFGIKFLSLEIQ